MLRILFLSVIFVLVQGCSSLNMRGIEAKDISGVLPSREYQEVYLGVPDEALEIWLSKPDRMIGSLEQVMENSGLFVDAIPTKSMPSEGVYIKTSFARMQDRLMPVSVLSLFGSIMTIGIIPLSIWHDYDLVADVYVDGRLVGTYPYRIKQSVYGFIPPLHWVPVAPFLGKRLGTHEKILMTRYGTNLVTDMQKDGILFGK